VALRLRRRTVEPFVSPAVLSVTKDAFLFLPWQTENQYFSFAVIVTPRSEAHQIHTARFAFPDTGQVGNSGRFPAQFDIFGR
jgi:hypothetical protein